MKLAGLTILLVACGGAQAPAPPDPRLDVLADRLEHALLPRVQVAGEEVSTPLADRMAELHIPGLSVAVFEDYRLVWAHAYGVTEAGAATPVTTSTLFQAGSISKSINAIAVLGAVADGTLSLDAPINASLKSWHLPDNELTEQTPVTIRHLLSHTAGTTVHGFAGYEAGAPVPTLVQVLDGAPPASSGPIVVDLAPGKEFRYSGGGTSITQLALVDNLGAQYPTILHDRVLAPLGMTASTYEQPLPDDRVDEAASGTYRNGDVVPGKRHVYPEMAAAGLWTTPSDLAIAFAEIALARTGKSKRLTQALADQMTTPVAAAGAGAIGLGVFLTDHNGVPVFGHGGADEGFQADAVASLDGGFGVIVMVNSDNGVAIFPDVERTVWAAMGWPGADQPITRVAFDGGDVAGDYRLPDGLAASIVVDGDALRFTLPLREPTELVPTAGGVLVDRVQGSRFTVDAQGALSITPPGGTAIRVDRVTAPHPLLELAAGRFDAAVAAWTPGVLEESVANLYGYELLNDARVDGAVALFRLIVAVFPDSANANDSLADGLVAAGDTAGAIASYEQALAKLDADPRIPAANKPAIRAYEEGRIQSLR